MAIIRTHGVYVDVGSYYVNPTEETRQPAYERAAVAIGRWLADFNRRYGTRLRRVFMHPVEQRTVKTVLPGFEYTLEKPKGVTEVWVYTSLVRGAAARLSDKDLADDMFRACRLMIERVCWQEGRGTYRKQHLRWKKRTLPRGTAFPGLAESQRGQIYWDMLPDSGRKEHECVITCPKCGDREWAALARRIERVVETRRSLRIDDIGYIVPQRTGEMVVVGPKKQLQSLVPTLRPLFDGRSGATARLRAAMSDAKGVVRSLA